MIEIITMTYIAIAYFSPSCVDRCEKIGDICNMNEEPTGAVIIIIAHAKFAVKMILQLLPVVMSLGSSSDISHSPIV
jgi:hypothetical protein